jgi:hypothetical protein
VIVDVTDNIFAQVDALPPDASLSRPTSTPGLGQRRKIEGGQPASLSRRRTIAHFVGSGHLDNRLQFVA